MTTPRTMDHAITPCLWFDHQAEEAANFYVEVFPDSRITAISRYGEAGQEIHGGKPGTVLTVAFELGGRLFTALNGGPHFTFSEAISLQVPCDSQSEIDYFWDRLGPGGGGTEAQCGWLKDRFGLSWQIVPRVLEQLLADSDRARADRVMTAILGMVKLDIEALENA